MIRLVKGNILRANAEALVNTVNCVGFMGRGIAAQFKRAFPENFDVYERACKDGRVQPGHILAVPTGRLTGPAYVLNFPTKRHWRGRSRIEDIDAGLEALVAEVQRLQLRSVAIPPLGCGLGGLDWSVVRPRIERAFASLNDVVVTIYEPDGAPAAEQGAAGSAPPKVTPGRAILVGLIERYLGGLLEPRVTLLEVHKLVYFAQAAGEPLRLRFAKAPYGPYAENLRHVLSAIEGHLVRGYGDGGDQPDKPLELLPGAAGRARAVLVDHDDSRARFDRVAALVDGYETPFGMELLASVHWVAVHGADGLEPVVEAIHGWSERKRRFRPDSIELAWRRLHDGGWLACSADR